MNTILKTAMHSLFQSTFCYRSLSVLTLSLTLPTTLPAAVYEVSSYESLAQAIVAANISPEQDVIELKDNITLTHTLPFLKSDLIFKGNHYYLDGDNRQRIFFIKKGSVYLTDITLKRGYAKGGNGGGGGGGGAGLGGAIFLYDGTLTLDNVTFLENRVIGGKGRQGVGGGGGGLGGNGGNSYGGGGGFWGNGGNKHGGGGGFFGNGGHFGGGGGGFLGNGTDNSGNGGLFANNDSITDASYNDYFNFNLFSANILGFQRTADEMFGGDLGQLVEYYRQSNDPVFESDAASVQNIVDRYYRISAEYEAMQANLVAVAMHVMFTADNELLTETRNQYSYTVPLNGIALQWGFAAAVVLFVLAELSVGCCIGCVRLIAKRKHRPGHIH